MKTILFALVALVALDRASATDPVPPLTVQAGDKCAIVDARPLLSKEKYANSKYVLKTLKKFPLTLEESIDLGKGSSLSIEQRGCEDIYFDFHFKDVPEKSSAADRIKKTLAMLRALNLSKDPILKPERLESMAKKISETKLKAGSNEVYVCLMQLPEECFTDVKVTVKPTEVEIYYVDRP
jgi:hypothetical protein